MPTSVPDVRVTPDRVPALAELLGGAFTDDPMLVWPFGSGRTEAITDFFRAFDERIAALGWLWEAGAGLGVAAWIPPGSDDAMMDIDRSMRSTLSSAEARHGGMWEWIAGHFPAEPFWYLDHIAVKADHRGSGLGGALIRLGWRSPIGTAYPRSSRPDDPKTSGTTRGEGSGPSRMPTRPEVARTSGSCATTDEPSALAYFSGTPRLSAKRLISSVCSS